MRAHKFHPERSERSYICHACDLNDKCNFYKNKSYRYSIGCVSSHKIPITDSYEERALLCIHRNKIFEREGLGVLLGTE